MKEIKNNENNNSNSNNSSNNNNEDGELYAIMFCEFDIDEGPKIIHQTPCDLISKSIFDSISAYIIPKPELKNRIITITVNNFRICGYPIYIEDQKYKRNRYIYNTCFIFDHNTNTCSYEAVVKKLACDLKILEIECEFLSNPQTKKQHLPELIHKIRTNLNTNGECIIQKIGDLDHSSLFLKLIKNHNDPQNIQSSDVPIFTTNYATFQVDDWDLTTKRIVNAINGFKTVAQIGQETNIEQSVVKTEIQNLIYLEVIMVVPIIQYSSMFVTTPKISQFYTSQSIQEESVNFVILDSSRLSPTFTDIFDTLTHFAHGVTVKDINERHDPTRKNIDLRKLILFGLMKGYLRKINKYPISKDQNQLQTPSLRHFIGNQNYDKICSFYGLSVKNLDERFDDDPNIVICIK